MYSRILKVSILPLLLGAALLVGITGCDEETPVDGLTPPSILSVTPANNAVDVALRPTVEIVFSMAMNRSSVEAATSFGDDRAPVEFGTTWSDSIYRITPDADLAPGALHTVAISVSAESDDGEAVSAGWSTHFTTIAAPTVVTTDPFDGDEQVSTHPEIVITFSEAMNHDSVEGALSFTNDREPIPYHVFWQGNNLRLEPEQDLPFNTDHTIALGTGAMSMRGIHLQAIFTLDFTTQTLWPVVVSTFPEDGATDVALNPSVYIQISQDMDETISEAALAVDPAVGMDFGDGWSAGGSVANISFDGNLAPSTLYTITVDAAAQGQGGETMQADYAFSFTTGVDVDDTPPTILSWSPANGATGVAHDIGLVGITFSEPVDPESVQPTAMDARFVMAMSFGEPDWNADFSALTLDVGNFPPGTTIFLDLGPFMDRAGNVSEDPDPWEITIAGTADWFPNGASDSWSFFGIETDEAGNPIYGMHFYDSRIGNISGNNFSVDRWAPDYREETLDGSEFYTKLSGGIEFRGFGELSGEGPAQEWVENYFSAPIDWLMLPPSAGQTWSGTTTLSEDGDELTVEYGFEVLPFEDLMLDFPDGGGGDPPPPFRFGAREDDGPDNITIPGCAPVVLNYELTLEDPENLGETIILSAGVDTMWYCPGVGMVRGGSRETRYEDGQETEVRWNRDYALWWTVGQ